MPEPCEYINDVRQNKMLSKCYQSIEHLVWLSLYEATTKKASNLDVKSFFFTLDFIVFMNLSCTIVTNC